MLGRDAGWLYILLGLGLVMNLIILGSRLAIDGIPWDDLNYEPAQPIAVSHRLHSGDLQISCVYCHPSARRSRLGGTPSPSLCMNCHRFVSATLGAVRQEEQAAQKEGRKPERIVSTEIRKIYSSLGLNDDLVQTGQGQPIQWVRVHRLPDFVFFHHGAHYQANVDCATCHGAVEKMERVSQFASLSMGWCVNCHRDYQGRTVGNRRLVASIDCGTCHM